MYFSGYNLLLQSFSTKEPIEKKNKMTFIFNKFQKSTVDQSGRRFYCKSSGRTLTVNQPGLVVVVGVSSTDPMFYTNVF